MSKVITCIYTCLYTKYIESFESVLLYKNVKCNWKRLCRNKANIHDNIQEMKQLKIIKITKTNKIFYRLFCTFLSFQACNDIFHKNPKRFWKYWHNLHTYILHFQLVIFSLKSFKKQLIGMDFFLILFLIHILLPSCLCWIFLGNFSGYMYFLVMQGKISRTGGDVLFIILYVSVINTCKFLWWIVISWHFDN